MQPANLIVIMSAGHQAGAMGHAGHPIVATPALDRLAAAGTSFDAAFTVSPMLADARATLAPDRWARALTVSGYHMAPSDVPPEDWIAASTRDTPGPWLLLVEPPRLAVCPDVSSANFDPARMPLPRLHPTDGYPRHPWVQCWHRRDPLDDRLDDETRQRLVAHYLTQCSELDRSIGRILAALDTRDLWSTTRVVYVSLVGHNLGNRGVWHAPTLYDDQIAIPLLVAGPGIPAGRRCRTPVGLDDLAATILRSVPANGRNLDDVAASPDETSRSVVAVCPACDGNSVAGMIRDGRFKYIAYEGFEPELFDLAADPGEEDNVARSHAYAHVRNRLERHMSAHLPHLIWS